MNHTLRTLQCLQNIGQNCAYAYSCYGVRGFHRFSMIFSMTQDGRQFFNHCQTLNTTSFLEHGQGVQGGRQDGPDAGQGTVAHIQGGSKILCRARHYCPVASYRTSISESRRGSMERTLTCNESFHTLCRQGCTSGSSV